MRIVVKPHEVIKPLIREWRRTLSDDPARRSELAEVYWEELVRRITDSEGPPIESVVDASTNPPTYWCELTGGTWVQLVVLPDERTGMFSIERKVVVINLAASPPV
jgi:hypothetical protein